MELNDIIILTALIQVVTLICFFVLCTNVSTIKKEIQAPQPFGAAFNFYLSIGQAEKAKELLIRAIMNEEVFKTAFFSNRSDKGNAQAYIEKKYKRYFDAIGLKVDFEKVNEFVSKF